MATSHKANSVCKLKDFRISLEVKDISDKLG
jgi:hypothetical protein